MTIAGKSSKMPNFLIVGAAKSGTTSLYHYLKQHPDVFMPTFKEPQYFAIQSVKGRLHKYVENKEEYENLFSSAKEKCRGEASVFYLYFYDEAIEAIKREIGDNVKIIIILRNPVERAFSAFQHVKRNNIAEKLSFEEALAAEEDRMLKEKNITPMVMYKQMSLYAPAVKAYRESFRKVHVLLYDDFKVQPEKCLREIFEFLHISSEDATIDFKKKFNLGGTQWKNQRLKNLLLKSTRLKKIIRMTTPVALRKMIFARLKSAGTIKIEESLKPETEEQLVEYFQNDIVQLENLLKVNLDNWKK